METTHRLHRGDARDLRLPADSVELVVTSPPYPMIEMWDGVFADLDPAVGEALADGDGERAFTLMHDVLDSVWAEVARVLTPGGIAAINVGDATRSFADGFRSFPNAAEITRRVTDHGLRSLPDVLWHKPANSTAKFMGSGMLPTNAYPTLEHEHVLLFRNGGTRPFPAGDERRYESAYFWEERNEWFSDLWEVRGEAQTIEDGLRERSGAFPFEIPYRLISMFSVYEDTVLDPFLGTGTTSMAAAVAGRNSVGYELDGDLIDALIDRMTAVPGRSRQVATDRLESHREWVAERREDGTTPGYEADQYDVAVTTKQERGIRFYVADSVTAVEEGYRVSHRPLKPDAERTSADERSAADGQPATGDE